MHMYVLRDKNFFLGYYWCGEFGNPDIPEEFEWVKIISPLHNIPTNPKIYPAILVTTADHDDRVVPAHSFKYAATLQEMYKGNNPVLIRIETNSGHGASNVTKNIEVLSDIYSFIFYNMGLKPEFSNLYKGDAEKKKPF